VIGDALARAQALAMPEASLNLVACEPFAETFIDCLDGFVSATRGDTALP
jgi:hypothetical protein